MKNGEKVFGRHHVKDCLKAKKGKNSRGRSKPSRGRRKPFKKEVAEDGSVWTAKVTAKKSRVSNDAMMVLKSAKNSFDVLKEMDDKIVKNDAEIKRYEQAEMAMQIPSLVAPKQCSWPWKPKKNIEIPIVEWQPKTTSPKRVEELKKEAKVKPLTVFKKANVMSFSDIQKKFSNTDSWGDSDDDC